MWKACRALSCSGRTHYYMHEVRDENPDNLEYLLNILLPWDQWATAHATCLKLGEMTSYASESANNWMGDVCDGNILDVHAGLVGKCMQKLHHRSKKYNDMNTLLPPDIESKLERVKAKGAALRLILLPGPDGWFLVKIESGG
jgi:hypothetical protein